MNPEFAQATQAIQQAFVAKGKDTAVAEGQVTPAQLIDAYDQFQILFNKLDQDFGPSGAIPNDGASELADHAIHCLLDLGAWAGQLDLHDPQQALEMEALQTALWAMRHGGKIRTLEPVVNALALLANRSGERDQIKALYSMMAEIIEHVSPEIQNDLEKTNPGRPWRILNMNFAIVGTRTQEPGLMAQSYETLGRNLPEDCPEFFEEAIKQAEKPVYGDAVKSVVREYFSRWTVRH